MINSTIFFFGHNYVFGSYKLVRFHFCPVSSCLQEPKLNNHKLTRTKMSKISYKDQIKKRKLTQTNVRKNKLRKTKNEKNNLEGPKTYLTLFFSN